jgi:hypothetical protein
MFSSKPKAKLEPKLEPLGQIDLTNLNDLMRPSQTGLIPSKENNRWNIDNSDKLEEAFKDQVKIFIIGPYKVGKSTLLSCLLDEGDKFKPLGDEVDNTKGMRFYHELVGGKRVIMTDSEGFFQPVENDDPIIREKFIMEFMKNSGDMLLVLFDRITTHDLKPIKEMETFYQESKYFKSMVIIHNMKNIKKIENLVKYSKKVCDLFNATPDPDNDMLLNSFVRDTDKPKQIQHLIVGDMYQLPDPYKRCVNFLKGGISASGTSKVNFKQVVAITTLKLLNNFYAVPYTAISEAKSGESKIVRIDRGSIHVDEKFASSLNRTASQNVFSSPFQSRKLSSNFVLTVAGREMGYITLVIDSSGIDPSSVYIELPPDGSVLIKCMKKSYDIKGISQSEIVESIESPVALIQQKFAVAGAMATIKRDTSGYILINFMTVASLSSAETNLCLESDLRTDDGVQN